MKMKTRMLLIAAVLVSCTALMIWLVVTAPSEAEMELMKYADEKEVSYDTYPESLVELMERNPEAEEFVQNYPFREGKTVDLSGYDVSKGVPLFLQWDYQWGYLPYGDDLVAVNGCGPVCLAMAGWYVSGGDAKFAPDKMVRFAEKNGYYADDNGSKWTLISEGGPALGLKVTELPLVEQKVSGYLKNGDPIIAIMGPGDFTSTGHYIVLTGYTDGKLSVNDPNSRGNSEKLWDYKTFASQVRNLWVIQKA